MRALPLLLVAAIVTPLIGQTPSPPDWTAAQDETMRHFQALIKFDTTDPPGGEKPAADYLKSVLDKEGIPTEVFALEPHRPNIVARLKGSGQKRPLLIMAHTDTVNVDPKKWTFPPFSATRDGGFVYGRGTVDDKDNVVAALMTMVMLKRQNVPLERDVIFLAEAGEEGATRIGIQFMAEKHFNAIDAEYCFAEGGSVTRIGGETKYASVQTLEKIPRAIRLTARGPAGHGSVPLESNAVTHLSGAVSKVAAWVPPIRLNETTGSYFKRLATISSPEEAERYRAALSPDTSVSGVKQVINDPSVEVAWASNNVRPHGTSRLGTDAFKVLEENVTEHYKVVTLPTMSTGATDMAYLRAKGIQCYGVGPATDIEDGPKGFGAHSDQERILESELHRFVRFHYDLAADLARKP
ncbi:MAG: M20/M25/M40 family metallo-hydrolase [Acidobacteria bacterium]|nr:M20/M25/M40 family metallo-hydrolase [Acidobacteriota bacterium]